MENKTKGRAGAEIQKERNMTLDEVRAEFIAHTNAELQKIKEQIRRDALQAKLRAGAESRENTVQELGKFANEVAGKIDTIMQRLSSFKGYEQGEALERRQELSVHICRPRVKAIDNRMKLTIVNGGGHKGREKSAMIRRKAFTMWKNRFDSYAVETYSFLLENGYI